MPAPIDNPWSVDQELAKELEMEECKATGITIYKCSQCGNVSSFRELYAGYSDVEVDDNEFSNTDLDFKLVEIECNECGATSGDGVILDSTGSIIEHEQFA